MLNLTLIIQSLNFWLAYQLLARFFFRPVLNHIQERIQKESFLNNTITNCHALLKDCEVKKQSIWRAANVEFNKYTDFCSQIGLKSRANDPGIAGFDLQLDAKEEFKIDELAQILVNKIMVMK